MPRPLFEQPLLPIASAEDAETSVRAVRPYLETADGKVTLVHVIEKAGGAPDKASRSSPDATVDLALFGPRRYRRTQQ